MEVISLNVNMVQMNVMVTWSRSAPLLTLQTMTQLSGRYIYTIYYWHVLVIIRLIVCMMSSPSPNNAGPECFQQMNLDYQPILVGTIFITTCVIVILGLYWKWRGSLNSCCKWWASEQSVPRCDQCSMEQLWWGASAGILGTRGNRSERVYLFHIWFTILCIKDWISPKKWQTNI